MSATASYRSFRKAYQGLIESMRLAHMVEEHGKDLANADFRIYVYLILRSDDSGRFPNERGHLATLGLPTDIGVTEVRASVSRLTSAGLVREKQHGEYRFIEVDKWEEFNGVPHNARALALYPGSPTPERRPAALREPEPAAPPPAPPRLAKPPAAPLQPALIDEKLPQWAELLLTNESWKSRGIKRAEVDGIERSFPAVNLEVEARSFIDYWSGQTRKMKSPMASWQNWCKKQAADNQNGTGRKLDGFYNLPQTADERRAFYGDRQPT